MELPTDTLTRIIAQRHDSDTEFWRAELVRAWAEKDADRERFAAQALLNALCGIVGLFH
jgi:hypothetical protein